MEVTLIGKRVVVTRGAGFIGSSSSNLPRVSIIILNWNSWKDTIECLESLYQITYPNYNVILIDNDSKDESIEKIKEYCEGKIVVESKFFTYDPNNKPIKIVEYTKNETEGTCGKEKEIVNLPPNRKLILIKNDNNYGFAEGNNIGIRYAMKMFNPEYVLLLNNDTVVDKKFLNELAIVAESDENIGIVGPKIYFYEKNGRNDIISFMGGKINLKKYPGYSHIGENLIDSPQYSSGIVECDWVTGTAMMIKVKNMPIKLLNSNLFFGCEDVDLSIRLKQMGYKMVAVLSSKIWHKTGISRKKLYKNMIRGLIRSTKTNLKFLKIHNPWYYLFIPVYLTQLFCAHVLSAFKKIIQCVNLL